MPLGVIEHTAVFMLDKYFGCLFLKIMFLDYGIVLASSDSGFDCLFPSYCFVGILLGKLCHLFCASYELSSGMDIFNK